MAVESMAVRRVEGAMHAIAVHPAGPGLRQVDVPDVVRLLSHADARDLRRTVRLFEDAEVDGLRVLGKKREVDAAAIPRRAEWIRSPRVRS